MRDDGVSWLKLPGTKWGRKDSLPCRYGGENLGMDRYILWQKGILSFLLLITILVVIPVLARHCLKFAFYGANPPMTGACAMLWLWILDVSLHNFLMWAPAFFM